MEIRNKSNMDFVFWQKHGVTAKSATSVVDGDIWPATATSNAKSQNPLVQGQSRTLSHIQLKMNERN